MNFRPAAAIQAMPGTAVPLRERATWALLALLPGTVLYAWFLDARFLASLAEASLLAAGLVLMGRPEAGRRDATLARIAVLALWLPPTTPWTLPVALLAMFAIELLFAGREVANPFHPAMIAAAVALMLFPSSPSTLGDSIQAPWIAAAWALGGLALVGARCVRWQAPLAMLAGAAGLLFAWQTIGPSATMDAALSACLPSFALTAFFIADDPPRACTDARARLLVGFAAGVFAAAAMLGLHQAHRDAQALPALAGVVVLMNATAPWLDRFFESPRTLTSPPA